VPTADKLVPTHSFESFGSFVSFGSFEAFGSFVDGTQVVPKPNNV
jgi:hypothetical protein